MSQVGSGREQLLSRAFVGLADTLVDDYDTIELLDQLVGYSVELLGADAAGILLADTHGTLRVVASSQEDAEVMELLQLQSDQGPCMECFRTGAPVSVPDLPDAAERWPVFVAAVAERGAYRSVHALPMRIRGEAIGTLNLFHRQPGALPDADLAVGQALADVATIGILSERAIRRSEVLTEQLQTALNSRVIIEQAKGVLAQRGNLSMDAASTGCVAMPAPAMCCCPRWPARSSRPTSPPKCSTYLPWDAEQSSGNAASVTPSNQCGSGDRSVSSSR